MERSEMERYYPNGKVMVQRGDMASLAAVYFPGDEEAQEFCLADWPEGQKHVDWFLAASEDEVRSWVEAGLGRFVGGAS